MIRVVELFAGIGAQREALRRLGIPHEAYISEIDPYAIRSYMAIHGDTPNLGDVTRIQHLPNDVDLLTYSFPCQDLSVAGNRKGMATGSGTRSSLLWEVGRLIRDAVERERGPRVLLMENVDAIINRQNVRQFHAWIRDLADLGYMSAYKVLNAVDFGIPQNRKRCFMISRRDGGSCRLPEGTPTDRTLADYLEDDPDPSCYLSDAAVASYRRHLALSDAAGLGYGWRPNSPDGTSNAIMTSPTKSRTNTVIDPTVWPAGTRRGHMIAKCGDGLVMTRPWTARGTVQRQRSPTLTCGTGCGTGTVDMTGRRWVRYLTPRECWRLMGQTDQAYDAAVSAGISRTQLYRQAGNSIVVDVLVAILDKIYNSPPEAVQTSILAYTEAGA